MCVCVCVCVCVACKCACVRACLWSSSKGRIIYSAIVLWLHICIIVLYACVDFWLGYLNNRWPSIMEAISVRQSFAEAMVVLLAFMS